jgi:hypothetical protein
MPPTKTGGLESTRLFSFTMEDQRGKKPPKFEFCAGLIEKKSPEKDFAQNLLMYVLSHLGTANRFKTTGTYKSEKSGEVYHQPLVLSARMRSGMKVSVLGVRACLATLKKMASKMNDKVQAWVVCYLIDWIYGRQWIANSVKPALSNVFNGVISHLGIKKNPVFTKWSELSKMPTGALKKKLGWGQMSPKAAAQPLIMQRRRGNTLIVAAKQPQSPAAPPAAEPAPSSLVAAVEAEVAAPALSSAAAASQAARHTKAGQSQSKPSQKKSAPSPKHKKPSSSVSSASVSSASASFSAPASSFSASQQKPTPPQQRLKRQQKLGKSGTPRTRPRENTPSAQERAPAVTTLERPKKRQKIVERESASSAAESATNASAAGGQKQKSSQKPLIQKYRTPYYRDTGIPGNHVYPSDGGLSQNGDLPPPKSNEDEEAAEQNAPSHQPMMSRVYSDSHIHRQFHPAMAMTMGECLYFDEHAMDGDSLESAFTYNCYSL